ncbi:GATA transcription factor 7-like [Dendrobium catenatum]|uniref:GATA transcription factor 7 n=1 Tax=Dendrobium catenatum TaxID=906689 RepID=A0A2I0VK31_9ASPA|nr:GATA transcription factor 7-like [Dendrobium catenatum]PKU63779.1 GATA transcription factor 7 [Dendrobium catenatum]
MNGLNETISSVEEAPVVEEFQVDDLLDLRGLPEPEKNEEEDDGDAKGVAFVSFEKESPPLSGISLPEETDAADLEWLSRFVHDCHSEYQPAFASLKEETACFPTKLPSPVDVWRLKKEALVPIKAKRSKRHRRTGAFWFIFSTFSVSSNTSSPSSSSSCCSSYKSQESYQKKRGRKPNNSAASGVSGDRQCTHCGVQKTPQWRAGPHGPKTLCNACGVRFKSGRLLPEYRPACSPTFVDNIHSNKHRKVMEMRRKNEGQLFSAAAQPVQSC